MRFSWHFYEREAPCIFCGGPPDCQAKCMEERARTFFVNPRIGIRARITSINPVDEKTQVVADRFCKFCGKLLVRRRYSYGLEVPPNFAKRKYCDRKCAYQDHAGYEIKDRYCAYCDKLLVLKPDEAPHRFAKRKYCDSRCSALRQHRKKKLPSSKSHG